MAFIDEDKQGYEEEEEKKKSKQRELNEFKDYNNSAS